MERIHALISNFSGQFVHIFSRLAYNLVLSKFVAEMCYLKEITIKKVTYEKNDFIRIEEGNNGCFTSNWGVYLLSWFTCANTNAHY